MTTAVVEHTVGGFTDGCCLHCGNPVPVASDRFCCTGCESVWSLLRAEGLDRYYELRGERGVPATQAGKEADHKWLEAQEACLPGRVTLDVQGIHCAACVWLFERVFERQKGGVTLTVNPAVGKLDLTAGEGFSLREFATEIERFGYRLGPSHKEAQTKNGDLLVRMGVAIAIAMNAMIFAFSFYAGLNEGPIYRMFNGIELGLGTLSVLVGGWVFFRAAWRALRGGIIHLDLPIALGIVLAYASSVHAYFRGSSATYFDTLTVFIALMLVGRFLQERVIERNRRAILASDGSEGLLTRRIEDGNVRTVRCKEVGAGDRLLVAPGDLVPVDGVLEAQRATVSLDWIDGESAPHDLALGAKVPAGAFNAGSTAFVVTAATAFDASPVTDLLRATTAHPQDAARASPWWKRFAKIYVVAVLVVGAAGFLGWWLVGGDLGRALDVTAGILIVTCPCAFGIATPMAYELAQAGLRRAGLFVRTGGFLDRAQEVERVVFDKTGTLTTGTLRVANEGGLFALPAKTQEILYNLAARSSHPRSAAIARALGRRARFVTSLEVSEEPGVGLRATIDGQEHTLGANGEEVALRRDGALVVSLAFAEDPRADAARELAALGKLGYETWIVSGDAQPRVDAMAASLGVPAERALGACKPQDKAAFLASHPRALMIGDGINDTLAVAQAHASGTPAIDRPFLPARTDFYFTTPGLGPITLALRVARALGKVTRRNLAIAVAYNAITVSLAYAGLLSPLVCAVVMPLSSVSVVGMTVASLSPRSPLWRS